MWATIILGIASLAFGAISTGINRKNEREDAEKQAQDQVAESEEQRNKARSEFDIDANIARDEQVIARRKQDDLDAEQVEAEKDAIDQKDEAIDEMRRNEFDSLAPQQFSARKERKDRDASSLERTRQKTLKTGGLDALQ